MFVNVGRPMSGNWDVWWCRVVYCLVCCLIFNRSAFISCIPDGSAQSSPTSWCLFIRSRYAILVTHTGSVMESMWLVFMNFKRAPRDPRAVISHHQSAVRPRWPSTSELSPWWPSDLPEQLQKLGVEVASGEGMECSVLELNGAALPNHGTVRDHTCTWDNSKLCLFLLRTDIYILLIV